MHYLMFGFAFLWFAYLAPLKITLAVCISLLLVTSIVKATATAVIGHASFKEVLRSVALAFAFMGVALFTLISFSKGTGMTDFHGISALSIFSAFLASYILGFKFGLGATFGSSAIIAGVSTTISGALFFILRPLVG
jgi:hypothetical protein